MEKTIMILVAMMFLGCATTSKIPVYSADDPRPKVYLKEAAKPYADEEYLIVFLNAFNHTSRDLQMKIECNWYNRNTGNKMANDQTSVKVKSGTKKRVVLSGYYLSDGTRFFEIKCNVVEMEVAKQ